MPAERKTLSAAAFVAELRDEACRMPIDPTLAQSLKYGKADVANVRRWAKDYFRYIEHDPQATAATLARRRARLADRRAPRRRRLFASGDPLAEGIATLRPRRSRYKLARR